MGVAIKVSNASPVATSASVAAVFAGASKKGRGALKQLWEADARCNES